MILWSSRTCPELTNIGSVLALVPELTDIGSCASVFVNTTASYPMKMTAIKTPAASGLQLEKLVHKEFKHSAQH
ncbi:hypothetical protein BC937DRAFT_90727 [Endogone sp. FLAS-F59071]|nr:hypothetical protein BC937DRAFT_90727 [Endogone sp. FLAS-F59071]|eukprot:RUS16853.1 hypothetical protein BC937DRAFT_90727 [Endogone sp. FLAS-F59071]